jgi:arylsulfatase A-like enzyme
MFGRWGCCAWLCAALALVACSPPERPGAVLITIDTLRADHVGAFSSDASTPHIDGLAREGTVFDRAFSPLPLTRPSHFSMLTGRHPREHGVLNNSTPLPDSAESVAEVLRDQGWRTAAFTATRILGPDSGAPQGFERFEATGSRRMRSGTEVVEQALAWLDELGPREPFFLWVHLYEPHVPYGPPEGFREGLDPAQAKAHPELSWSDLQRIARSHGGDVPAAILEHARELYRAEVAAADSMIGTFLSGLGARTDLDRLLILLTADHGECFENGFWFEHSDCLYDGSLRVPLIVRQPGVFPAGGRVAKGVSLLDVAPTLLRSAEAPGLEAATGRSLQELGAGDPRHFLVQHPFYSNRTATERKRRAVAIQSVAGRPTRRIDRASQWMGVIGPRWKLLLQDGVAELYPAKTRVDESQNVAASEPAALEEMRGRLADELRALPLEPAPGGEISPELREALEALGYVD